MSHPAHQNWNHL